MVLDGNMWMLWNWDVFKPLVNERNENKAFKYKEMLWMSSIMIYGCES